MKNIYKSSLVCLLLIAASCQDYLDVNFDPRNPQVAQGFAVLPPVLGQMARGEAFDTRFIGAYIQNWSTRTANNVWDLHGFVSGSDSGGEIWRSHYWSIGKNIDVIIEDASAKGQWDYVGAAYAIRAWSWQTLTDYHGEAILKEAWEPNRYVFDYDSQPEIYAEVIRLCGLALENLNKTGDGVDEASLGRGDLVYKGKRDKWIKFVYAILARNANHLSNKSIYTPDKVIEYVDKSLSSNADNFAIPHAGTSSTDANFYGPLRANLTNFRPTKFFVSLLNGAVFKGVVDPRISLMMTASPDGIFRGITPSKVDTTFATDDAKRMPTLWGGSPALATTAQPNNKYVFFNNAAHYIITYPELQFMKAEAAFIKGDKNMALDAFKKGITAHMDFCKVSAANRDAYLSSAAIPQVAADLKISDIMMQKYISLWVIGSIESWVDMRRYHYDPNVYKGFELPNPLASGNNNKPAYRVRPRYNSEYVWNLETLNKLGGSDLDYHTRELWFSQK
ncbi:MAG: SusD/RagB family nutrient-binding outer membrane lipoprotein [Saprospiraceae bacterium]